MSLPKGYFDKHAVRVCNTSRLPCACSRQAYAALSLFLQLEAFPGLKTERILRLYFLQINGLK